MSENNETYNGYANRETWAFNLHWSNDEGFYHMALDFARNWLDDQEGAEIHDWSLGHDWVEQVMSEIPELSPELWENMRSDVGSFWRIDYAEVGSALRESVKSE